ncbi:MAG: CAP domain-containing protein, partial [Chloroflexota bacterium]|nr:CAP domain-containing protein [Chloroflexota bacterium]
VKLIGYPLSEVIVENGTPVQYFERQLLEYHKEAAGTPYGVQLSRLGAELAKGKVSFAPVAPFASTSNRVYIPQTGLALSSPFLGYWRANRGARLFGYPLSEAVNRNGHLVQYFERARMEYHPEKAGSGYAIELGPLGKEYLDAHPEIGAQIVKQGLEPSSPQPPAAAGALYRPALSAKETILFDLINKARTDAQMQAVQIDPAVTLICAGRTSDMAARNYFSHNTPEGKNFLDFLKTAHVPFKAAGEIIAFNNTADDQTAAQAYAQFMNSPPHRSIIMDPKYNAAGVSETADAQGAHFYTVIFVQK